MTTIDNQMALADNYATLTADTAAVTKAREALCAALTEALVAQPVRETLTDGLDFITPESVFKAKLKAHGIGGDK